MVQKFHQRSIIIRAILFLVKDQAMFCVYRDAGSWHYNGTREQPFTDQSHIIFSWGMSLMMHKQIKMVEIQLQILNNYRYSIQTFSNSIFAIGMANRWAILFAWTRNVLIIWLSNILTERTWWRLFQKRVVCTIFDIYVFITITESIPLLGDY